jgi:hypothetical protein
VNTIMTHWASTAPTWQTAGIGISVLLAALWLAAKVRKVLTGHDPADLITAVIALAATGYAGTGTWKYLGEAMGYGVDLKAFLVAVLEGAQIAEALRARKNIRELGTAGVDGIGLWVLTGISATLSTSVAGNVREALGRAVIPAVGAWLWERALAPQRRAARARRERGPVRWRITPERVFVWLRLADAVDTDVSTVEAGRRVSRYLRTTDRAARKWRRPWSPDARADRARMRLTQHALMHGDPTEVHEQLADSAFGDALRRLGIGAPGSQGIDASGGASEMQQRGASDDRALDASGAGQPALVMPQMRRIRSASANAAEARLKADALDIDRASIADTNQPAGLRQLQRELGIGQARATELRAWLADHREQFAAVERANGHRG